MTSACRLFPLGHGVPENFNFWGEQRQWSYPPISGAVWLFTTHLSNASAKVLLLSDMSDAPSCAAPKTHKKSTSGKEVLG